MALLAQMPGLPTLACLAGVVLMIAIVLLRTQRYYARHAGSRPSLAPEARPAPSSQPSRADAPARMVEWEVEMHETARELSAQLDSKMAALEHLIREADRAAARLEAALAAAPPRATDPGADAAQRLQRLTPGEADPADRPAASQAEALRPLSPGGAGGAAVPSERDPADPAPGRRPPREQRYEPIYTLADYGYDAAEIARRTGTPLGEVQLILSLRAQAAGGGEDGN